MYKQQLDILKSSKSQIKNFRALYEKASTCLMLRDSNCATLLFSLIAVKAPHAEASIMLILLASKRANLPTPSFPHLFPVANSGRTPDPRSLSLWQKIEKKAGLDSQNESIYFYSVLSLNWPVPNLICQMTNEMSNEFGLKDRKTLSVEQTQKLEICFWFSRKSLFSFFCSFGACVNSTWSSYPTFEMENKELKKSVIDLHSCDTRVSFPLCRVRKKITTTTNYFNFSVTGARNL